MALEFPASPTNGQLYPAAPNSEYIYSTAKGAWLSLPTESAKTVTSDNAPANPKDGDQWFNTVDGTLYIYIVDVDGGQWVESQAPITANGYYSPNYLINGAFDIWQRGTSLTQSGGGVGCDMWREYTDSGSGTQSRDTTNFVSGISPQSYRFTAGANSTNWTIWQVMESSHCASLIGQTVTFSVYLMASTARTFRLSLGTNTTADAGWSAGGWVTSSYLDVNVGTTWARYSFTTTVPSTAKTIQFSVSSNGANMASGSWVNVAAAQVELGIIATTFRRNANSLQGELAACQRYYWRNQAETIYSSFGSGFWEGGSVAVLLFIDHPVPMRVAPTAIDFGGPIMVYDGGSVISVSSLTIGGYSGRKRSRIYAGLASNGTSARPYELMSNNSTASYIGFSAEL